jgi:hypothetical protein
LQCLRAINGPRSVENVPLVQPAPEPSEYVDETRLGLDGGLVVIEFQTEDAARVAFKMHPKQAHRLSDQLLQAYAESLRREGITAEMPEKKTASR